MGIDQKTHMAMAIQRDYSNLYFVAKHTADSLRKFNGTVFSDTLNDLERNILNKALNVIENVQQEHTNFKAEMYFQKWEEEYNSTQTKL